MSAARFDPCEIVAPEAVGLCPRRLERLNDLFRGYVDSGDMAGAATLIARRGRVAHLGTFGMAHREEGRPTATDTLFRIASMTKPITSVAVMMLIEEGRLVLTDPVERHLPEFSDAKVLEPVGEDGAFRLVDPKRPMTVRHLLTHTSGLTYGQGHGLLDSYYRVANVTGSFGGPEPLSAVVSRIGRVPLLCHPGERWEYSYSTDVLGRLVEVASGADLAGFFRTRIFDPLGMADTHFFLPPEKVQRLARVYGKTSGGEGGSAGLEWFPAEYPYEGPSAYLSGGAGLTSSILDYARFLQMMLDRGTLNGERILGPRTVDQVTVNHVGDVTTHGPGFGFGARLRRAPRSRAFRAVRRASAPTPGEVTGTPASGWTPRAELFVITMTQLFPSDHVRTGEQVPPLIYQALLD